MPSQDGRCSKLDRRNFTQFLKVCARRRIVVVTAAAAFIPPRLKKNPHRKGYRSNKALLFSAKLRLNSWHQIAFFVDSNSSNVRNSRWHSPVRGQGQPSLPTRRRACSGAAAMTLATVPKRQKTEEYEGKETNNARAQALVDWCDLRHLRKWCSTTRH